MAIGGLEMDRDKAGTRNQLLALLGDLPERGQQAEARVVAVEERPVYILERLLLDLNGLEPVPAYFIRPRESAGRVPVVLYNHAHAGDYVLGKDELLAGRPGYLQDPPYAVELARRGWAALCLDAWGFGERRGRSESELFKLFLWQGRVMWGMMVHDSLRALDYLCSRPDVDAERIGTLGLSMGSTMAWWAAALDERVRVCVDLCCLTDYHALIESRGLDGHGIYYYVPGLLKQFTTARINSLIAPRPHLSLAGNYDPLTPPDGLTAIDRELRRIYEEEGAPEAWRLSRYETGHLETAAMRAEALEFLEKWL